MAMATPCAGCRAVTSWLVAAQFTNGDQQRLIVCRSCWSLGIRVFLVDGHLDAGMPDQFEDYPEAVMYWDEGMRVTGRIDFTYPSRQQPGFDA